MRKLGMLMAATLLAACAGEPAIQSGPDAERTFDGLVRIDNSRFQNAWIDPDVDLRQYNKIIPVRAEFEFRAVKKSRQATTLQRSSQDEFWMSPEDRERLVTEVSEVFQDELKRSSSFTITDTPAPDALIVVGTLHDIVSRVPPNLVGRGELVPRRAMAHVGGCG